MLNKTARKKNYQKTFFKSSQSIWMVNYLLRIAYTEAGIIMC